MHLEDQKQSNSCVASRCAIETGFDGIQIDLAILSLDNLHMVLVVLSRRCVENYELWKSISF